MCGISASSSRLIRLVGIGRISSGVCASTDGRGSIVGGTDAMCARGAGTVGGILSMTGAVTAIGVGFVGVEANTGFETGAGGST